MIGIPPPDNQAQCGDDGLPLAHQASPANRAKLAETVRYWNLPIRGIWLHYFSLGGDVGEYELDAYINASYALSALQHDILAQSINELIDERPLPPRAPYCDDVAVAPDPRGNADDDGIDE